MSTVLTAFQIALGPDTIWCWFDMLGWNCSCVRVLSELILLCLGAWTILLRLLCDLFILFSVFANCFHVSGILDGFWHIWSRWILTLFWVEGGGVDSAFCTSEGATQLMVWNALRKVCDCVAVQSIHQSFSNTHASPQTRGSNGT